jgi:hypothetical protein
MSAEQPAENPDEKTVPSIEEYLAEMPYGMGALNDTMGIELKEISAERVVATMPVEGNTQPYGLLHGGASVVLAETLGSVLRRRRHQRDPPPLGHVGHGHRRGHRHPPGAYVGQLRDRHHRRVRPPHLHFPDHLRPGPRRPLPLTLPGRIRDCGGSNRELRRRRTTTSPE